MTPLLFLLFAVTAATASFDLVGSFDVAGGNLRVTNLVMMLFGSTGLLIAFARGFPRVVGFGWIALWTLVNAACMVNAPAIFRTYAYTIWLAVDVLFIFTLATAFRGDRNAWRLASLNYWIYALVAFWGLAQFALFIGGVEILVKQRWTARFPRINGFSYEPSYYATYLIVGWAMALYLILHPVQRIGRRARWIVFGACTAALLLSTSRMGFIGMAVMLVLMSPTIASRLWSAGRSGMVALILIGVLAGGTLVAAAYSLRKSDPTILLEGTGLAGTHAHSVDSRMGEFLKYWQLIVDHPFRGYSLGGIAGVMAGAGGSETVDYETLRKSQGINVSFEVILATGLLAAPLFFIYLGKLTLGVLIRPFAGADPDLIIMTKANAWGLLLQFLLLQFNQNILRNYFWIQLAVVSCLVTEAISQHRFASVQASPADDSVEPSPQPAGSTLLSA